MITRLKLGLHRITYAVSAVLIAVLGCAGESASAPPHDGRVEAGLQQVLDRAVAQQDFFLPGAIAHYRSPGYAPWSGSAGLGEIDAQIPIRSGNLIRAGSILKTFVSTVTLQLAEEGKLSLDQKLTELLPASVTDRVANADRISLRMLLNHTSGIPEWDTPDVDARIATNPAHIFTVDEELGMVEGQSLFEPGTSWSYSNTNYALVGLVLDQVGGKPWRAQVRERVIVPLGLASTELPDPGDRTVTSEYAHGYVLAGGTPVDLSYVDPSMAGAAGGNAMVSTLQDLATFLDALLAGRLFARPETLSEMLTMVDAPENPAFPHRYGLGVESYTLNGTTIVGNAGGAAGYATMMYRIPANGSILVTAITAGDLLANALQLLIPSLDVIAGQTPPSP